MYYRVLVIYVLAWTSICESYKILLMFPFPFKSHAILGESFVKLLLKAGHEISYITPSPVEYSHSNLSQIVIKLYNYIGTNLEVLGIAEDHKVIHNEIFNVSYSALTDTNVRRLMEDTAQHFDLVIVEWMFNDLYSGFSAVFNCPYIWFFSLHDDRNMMRLIHETPNPSMISNFRTNNVPPLNFLQKTQELIHVITFETWKYFYCESLESEIYEEIFGPVLAKRGRALPPFEKVRYNASLVFSNSHLTIRDSPIMPQSYKAIGGFHIFDNTELLNQELLNIMENSGNGVVLFSLGSHLKAEDMPSSVKRDLLTMFSKINYTVLWKIDNQFKDLPSNVKTFPWIPLQRVLKHPKCVLFITHGGILSLTESVHYGVPVVGVPVFADQTVNLKSVVKKGVARMVPMSSMLAKDLKEAIEDVLSNIRYKANMMKLSSLYYTRPLPPGAELVHWVEHVVATRGALHLRSPALLVPWYQKCYLDLAAVVLVTLIGLVFIVNKLYTCIISKVKVIFHTDHGMKMRKKIYKKKISKMKC